MLKGDDNQRNDSNEWQAVKPKSKKIAPTQSKNTDEASNQYAALQHNNYVTHIQQMLRRLGKRKKNRLAKALPTGPLRFDVERFVTTLYIESY